MRQAVTAGLVVVVTSSPPTSPITQAEPTADAEWGPHIGGLPVWPWGVGALALMVVFGVAIVFLVRGFIRSG
jgi:hypothetical protein